MLSGMRHPDLPEQGWDESLPCKHRTLYINLPPYLHNKTRRPISMVYLPTTPV